MPALESKPTTKRRPRFSLLGALLLITVAASVFGLVRARDRNRELVAENARVVARANEYQAENIALRAELGILTVTHPTKFHAMQLESDNSLEWKWRVYVPELPAGQNYDVSYEHKAVWRKGQSSDGTGRGGIEPGQQTVTFRIVQDRAKGDWYGELRTKSSKDKITLPPVGGWPSRSFQLSSDFGPKEVKVVTPGEAIELFNLRLTGRQTDRDAKPWPHEPYVEMRVTLEPPDAN